MMARSRLTVFTIIGLSALLGGYAWFAVSATWTSTQTVASGHPLVLPRQVVIDHGRKGKQLLGDPQSWFATNDYPRQISPSANALMSCSAASQQTVPSSKTSAGS